MASPPTLGTDPDSVLDAFLELHNRYLAIGYAEARIILGPSFRWGKKGDRAELSVVTEHGLLIRPATDAESAELEYEIAQGRVQIVCWNRISRETLVMHQATGRPFNAAVA